MDSVTLAYFLSETHQGEELLLVSFDYGQRHRKELSYAEECARALKARWMLVPLNITHLLEGSALTDMRVDVPLGHYASESMKQTVVPNRNMVMLSLATAIAVTQKAHTVYAAMHAGDHAIYPDCRPEFIESVSETAKLATEGFARPGFCIAAPFVNKTKTDICKIGHTLNVPWEQTWSCYKGELWHCGKCGTCVERKEAFEEAGLTDPTIYSE